MRTDDESDMMNLDDKEQAITIEVGSNEPVAHISLEGFDYLCSVFERLLDKLEREDFAHARAIVDRPKSYHVRIMRARATQRGAGVH